MPTNTCKSLLARSSLIPVATSTEFAAGSTGKCCNNTYSSVKTLGLAYLLPYHLFTHFHHHHFSPQNWFLLVVLDNCLVSSEPNTPPALTKPVFWVTRPSRDSLSTGHVSAGEDARGPSTRVGSWESPRTRWVPLTLCLRRLLWIILMLYYQIGCYSNQLRPRLASSSRAQSWTCFGRTPCIKLLLDCPGAQQTTTTIFHLLHLNTTPAYLKYYSTVSYWTTSPPSHNTRTQICPSFPTTHSPTILCVLNTYSS